MNGFRQRMRRRTSAETTDTASASPEVQPGGVTAPVAAEGTTAPGGAQPTVDAAAVPPGTPAPAAPTPAAASVAAGTSAPAPATPPATPDAAAAAVPGAAPAPGTPGAAPADVAAADPTAGATPEHPGFATRGRLRRRLRYLRRVRELGYRDLGGLVFDQHRFARPNETLVQTKVAALAQIDGEVRALENALEDKRAVAELREAGIAACPRCGAIHGSESRYCPACGLALSGPTEMAAVHAPAHAGAPVAPAPTAPPSPVTITPMPAPVTPTPAPAPVTPPIVGRQPTTPPSAPDAPAAPAPAPPAAPTPNPAADDAALQHTIHLRAEDDQSTTVFRAADAGPGGGVTSGISLGTGDPLTGPRPSGKPDLQSGDPLAPKPQGDSGDAGTEPESRP